MTDNPDDSREMGVEFGSLAEELEEESYPLSHEEVLDKYGDHELDLADGSTTVSDVLDPENEREFEDAGEVRQAILNMVGDDAVGREGYSDRAGSTPDSESSDDAQSL